MLSHVIIVFQSPGAQRIKSNLHKSVKVMIGLPVVVPLKTTHKAEAYIKKMLISKLQGFMENIFNSFKRVMKMSLEPAKRMPDQQQDRTSRVYSLLSEKVEKNYA